MSVRHAASRLGAVCLLVATTVFLTAVPVGAAGEAVRVRAPNSISAGGSPGSVTVNVSMRSGDCVSVRTSLGIHLPGLTADRVEVRVAADGGWRRVPVSAAGGLVVTERTAPNRPELCARKNVSSRYRVTLLAGAPAGRVGLLAEAHTANGRLLGRGTDTARVSGRTGVTPAPTPSTAEALTPSPTVEQTEEAVAEPTQEVAAAAALPGSTPAGVESGGSLGLGGLVMLVGLVMVGIGVALLVLLIRRGRADRARRAAAQASADADRTARIVVLGAEPAPRVPPADASPTTRIPPVGASPTTRIPPVGAAGPAAGGGPGSAGGVRPPAGAAVPGFGEQTLILPTAGGIPPRPAGATPPRQAGPVPPHPGPPVGAGGGAPGEVPARADGAASRPSNGPARLDGRPPGEDGPVPPEQPSAGGPDATLILPPARRRPPR
ncbi:hypothetical protein ACN28C_33805 [Plantactinospora sp. WMMC1484]|uniref:hypothetical protein n=1 Tax=Plantactinospora sp. WMMC1484 TaxID=3404122 RepID=UPI003BF5E018